MPHKCTASSRYRWLGGWRVTRSPENTPVPRARCRIRLPAKLAAVVCKSTDHVYRPLVIWPEEGRMPTKHLKQDMKFLLPSLHYRFLFPLCYLHMCVLAYACVRAKIGDGITVVTPCWPVNELELDALFEFSRV